MLPERLGRFGIDSLLGQGGMGAVYAARDPETGERVALKVLSATLADDEDKFRRFEQEVTALARIEHENIVRLVGPIERDGDRIFFPMELLEGTTLAAKLRAEGPQPVPAALAVVKPLLRALGAAHAAGVVHRDIKPSNVILTEEGPKLTDFGLARMEDLTRLTRTGQLMGTLDYMSPEQCEGDPMDHRTDLYSVGILLYEMLTGAPPFRRESPGAVLRGHLTETAVPVEKIRADLPEGLPEIVETLIAKHPDDRFPSAEAALEALSRVPDPSVTVTFCDGKGPTTLPRPAPPARRKPRKWFAPAVAGGLVVVAALLALRLLRPGRGGGYPDRTTPERTLQTIHDAIRKADFATFRSCFDSAAIESFPDAAEAAFRRRAKEVVDYAFEADIPRSLPAGDLTVRVVRGAALPAVLGLAARVPLHVSLRRDPDGFRVVRLAEERAPRGPGRRIEDRRAFLERTREMERMTPEILVKLLREGGVSREKLAELAPKMRERRNGGEWYKCNADEDDREIDLARGVARVGVRIPELARDLGLTEDRFVLEYGRGGPRGKLRLRSLRPPAR